MCAFLTLVFWLDYTPLTVWSSLIPHSRDRYHSTYFLLSFLTIFICTSYDQQEKNFFSPSPAATADQKNQRPNLKLSTLQTKKFFFIFFSREINPLIFCHFSCIHGFYIVCKICSSVIGSFIFYLLPDASGLELRSLIGNVSDKIFSPNFETSDHLMKFFTFFYFLFAVLLSELWNWYHCNQLEKCSLMVPKFWLYDKILTDLLFRRLTTIKH